MVQFLQMGTVMRVESNHRSNAPVVADLALVQENQLAKVSVSISVHSSGTSRPTFVRLITTDVRNRLTLASSKNRRCVRFSKIRHVLA